MEGDPDHPINRGTLCPKGSSLQQDILNERRLLKPQVRRPGSDHWEDIAWDDAYRRDRAPGEEDARRNLRRERRAGPHRQPLEGIAWNGGCTDTNEFNYLVVKTMRSLGLCYLENQARV